MPSNALLKTNDVADDFSQDNLKIIEKLWEARRARLAIVAHDACEMPDTLSPDLGEFEEKYFLGSKGSFA